MKLLRHFEPLTQSWGFDRINVGFLSFQLRVIFQQEFDKLVSTRLDTHLNYLFWIIHTEDLLSLS